MLPVALSVPIRSALAGSTVGRSGRFGDAARRSFAQTDAGHSHCGTSCERHRNGGIGTTSGPSPDSASRSGRCLRRTIRWLASDLSASREA